MPWPKKECLQTLWLPYARHDCFIQQLEATRSGTRTSMRQRAFNLGLFKKYLLSIVTAQLQREVEIPFEGLVDVPRLMCEPLRSVPLVQYVRPTTFEEVSLKRLVNSIAEHLSRTVDFDPETRCLQICCTNSERPAASQTCFSGCSIQWSLSLKRRMRRSAHSQSSSRGQCSGET